MTVVKLCVVALAVLGTLVGCGTHQQRLSGSVGPLGSGATPSVKPSSPPNVTWGPFTYNSQGNNAINSLSIQAPGNWGNPAETLGRYDWRDPTGQELYRLQFSKPTATAISNWYTESTDFAKSHPGYKEISIKNVACPQGARDCAEWRFTFPENGVTRQVIDRSIVVNDDFAFAIYLSGPRSQFSLTKQIFDHALDSIQLSD